MGRRKHTTKGFQKGKPIVRAKKPNPLIPEWGVKEYFKGSYYTLGQKSFNSLPQALKFQNEIIEFQAEKAKKEKEKKAQEKREQEREEQHDFAFIGSVDKFREFVNPLLKSVPCATSGCKGRYQEKRAQGKGLGGVVNITYQCAQCGNEIVYHSDRLIPGTQRGALSTQLMLASLLNGGLFAGYKRGLGPVFGDHIFTKETWRKFLLQIDPIIRKQLEDQCELAKAEMKKKPDDELGSWKRAVTTSDGCWQIRGYHSPNSTFVIVDFMNHALLYVDHTSMKGGDDVWKGTAKGAEGYLATKLFKKATEDGMKVEVNFQDADSSSKKAVEDEFEGSYFVCGGHFNRAFGHQLEKLSKEKTSDTDDLKGLKCHCQRHSKNCGCLTAGFLLQAKINHFIIMKNAGKDANKYRKDMTILAKHAKGDHSECTFHDAKVCSCGKCEKGQRNCEGKDYRSSYELSCPFHSKAFELECLARAGKAEYVIHPELGKGHSNLPESIFSVLTHFRDKNVSLQKLTYEITTNLGLLCANEPFMKAVKGPAYNWQEDLQSRTRIPISPEVAKFFDITSSQKAKASARHKSEKTKSQRLQRKKQRSAKAEKRKEFMKTLEVMHSYGGANSDDEQDDKTDAAPRDDVVMSDAEAETDADDLWIVFDIEATGRNTMMDEMTEIAAIAVLVTDAGVMKTIGDPFSTYVKTVREIPPDVEKLTGIKSFRHPDSPLKAAPVPKEVLSSFTSWVEGVTKAVVHRKRVLVGHNIQSYDLRLISRQLRRSKVNFEEEMRKRKVTGYVDTYRRVQKVAKTLQFPYKLDATASGNDSLSQTSLYQGLFNHPPQHAHRALGDISALVEIMRSHFNSKTPAESLKDLAAEIFNPKGARKATSPKARLPCPECHKKLHTKNSTCSRKKK